MRNLPRAPLLIINLSLMIGLAVSLGLLGLMSWTQSDPGKPLALAQVTPSATPALSAGQAAPPTASLTPIPTHTLTPTSTATPTITLTPTLTPRPLLPTAPRYLDLSWQQMSVIPQVSPAMKEVYLRGLALGNDPHAFSKVGDCNTASEFFLIPFEQPEKYRLGPYADLQILIDNFAGSFGRTSLAARTGFGPSAMFDHTWVDPTVCLADEGPLACEFRLHRPSLVLIGLGTHYPPLAQFESQMRAVIEFSLDRGVVPILATKVDTEGGDRVNAIIVYLAQQYEVPLWNFWRAEQPLYNHGQPEGDGIHFTWASNYFDSRYAFRNGWPVRNLTALQALQAVWLAVSK